MRAWESAVNLRAVVRASVAALLVSVLVDGCHAKPRAFIANGSSVAGSEGAT